MTASIKVFLLSTSTQVSRRWLKLLGPKKWTRKTAKNVFSCFSHAGDFRAQTFPNNIASAGTVLVNFKTWRPKVYRDRKKYARLAIFLWRVLFVCLSLLDPMSNRPFWYIKIHLNIEAQWTQTKEMNKHGHSISSVCVLQASLRCWTSMSKVVHWNQCTWMGPDKLVPIECLRFSNFMRCVKL